MEPTILDVAEKAGVSPSTVSRVINETAPVAEATKKKVTDAIESLGYRTNKFAHALRKQSSNVFGIIVPDISNPFFSTLIRGAEDRFHEGGLSTMICDTKGEPKKEIRNIEMLVKERVDGVVATSTESAGNGINRLFEEEIPVVAVDRSPTSNEITTVLADNEGSGKKATRHLLEKGCRRIGFVRGPSGVSTAHERFTGYVNALEERELHADDDLITQGDFTFSSGKRALERLREKNRNSGPPDGLVVANDLMAVGVIRKAEELNVKVPGDLAVVGFDDILLSKLINPTLTTVSAPTYRMGATAAGLLLNEVESNRMGRADRGKRVVFATELVERESSQLGGG
ncbi:MAG: LacI family DNA-binding transcriptional regulator [Candidatus Acetothermia bacterium]